MIPGHGGIMDRFDCQFLMATFVNVYISSFIRTASPAKLLTQVSHIVCYEVYVEGSGQIDFFALLLMNGYVSNVSMEIQTFPYSTIANLN